MRTDAHFLLDIDKKPENLTEFATEFSDRLVFLHFFTEFCFNKIHILETKKGYHIYLWTYTQTPTPIEAVLIQLALGSDYRRELFNYNRVWSKNPPPRWNILFRSKYNGAGQVVSREERTDKAVQLEEEIMKLYTTKVTKEEEQGERTNNAT